jgi:hypothetical protein
MLARPNVKSVPTAQLAEQSGLRLCRCNTQVSASGSTLTGSSTKARVVTAPRRLQEAIAAKLRDLGHQPDAAPADAAGAAQQRLPSGEGTVQALLQLQEDVHEYDVHVYRRMPQRDRL